MPQPPDRRTFLKWSAAAAVAGSAGCGPDDAAERAAGTPAGTPATPVSLPADPLRALAHACLPDELGPDGKTRVLREFQAWLDGFAPVGEQVHGYGSQEITFGPPDPRPGWAAQLEALDLEADARYGARFADLDPAARRDLLEVVLEGERGGLASQPAALEAGHIAAGLLGFFFGSPAALDLGYRRRIGAFGCRPLEASADIPAPFADGAAARSSASDWHPGDPDADDPDHSRLAAASSRRPPRPIPSRIEPGLEPGS